MLNTRYRPLVYAAVAALVCGVASVEAQGDAKAKKADAGVAAYIGDEAILMKDVDAKALGTNMKLAQSMYDARRAALDEIIMEWLAAKDAAAQGITVDELIEKQVAEKTVPVTDAAVEAYYNSKKSRMGNRTLEQVGPQIKAYLVGQNATEARTQKDGQCQGRSGGAACHGCHRGQRPGAGSGRRQGEHRDLLGVSMTVLCQGRSDPKADSQHLRRQGPFGLSRLPAPQPQSGSTGGRGGPVRQRAGQVLGIPRQALRQPAGADRRELKYVRGRPRA